MVPYRELFRYATTQDKILIVIGTISSLGNGVSMPMFAVIFGGMTDSFSGDDTDKMVRAAGECAM